MRWRPALLVFTAAVALATAGCGAGRAGGPAGGGTGAVDASPPPGARAQPASCLARSGSAAPVASRSGQPLPDLTLPCLAQTGTVAVARLARPAVINLWASWCAPCRQELPEFQRFAEHAGDAVVVLGVDSDDTRSAGQALVADLGLRFPMLFDDRAVLRKAVGRVALPVTLFVDASGGVAFVHNGQTLDEAAIGLLARKHLGIGP